MSYYIIFNQPCIPQAAVAMIVVSEVPVDTDAFLEPFASQLIAKKMLLKHGFAATAPPSGQTTQYIYYGGQYQHHPQPRPAPPQPQPQVSYPAYGPQTTYASYGPPASYSGYSEQAYVKPAPAYGPQTSSYPSYGPPASYSGYSEQAAPVVKPAPSYGSVTYVGYSEQPAPVVIKPVPSYGPPASYGGYNEQPEPVVKPTSAPCPPASQPTTQVDFSNYAVHGGHGFSNNNGGYGK